MKTKSIIKVSIICFTIPIFAQTQSISNKGTGPSDFSKLIFNEIPGAPSLSSPKLIMGETKPVIGEGMGWAAPAVFDWNGDGKKDLLIGEFGSGLENGQNIGSFVRVYLNDGADDNPKFSDEFKYATPQYGSGIGTPLSIFTTCCTGFTPQILDLDNDGFKDIVTGQYHPGEVIWFRGSEKGFFAGQKLLQEGDPSANNPKLPITDIKSTWYWTYSAVSFGDFDGDGDFDMIAGGGGLRISKNIGTKENPKFGERNLLMDTNGNPLVVFRPNEEQKDMWSKYQLSGSFSCVPYAVDWNSDGILDLLVTSGHYQRGESSVTFFEGVKAGSEIRFKVGIPLFYVENGEKSFPGSWLRVYVTDWNNDGINDLLIGTSVAILNGTYNYDLSWSWEEETKTLKKNPGIYDVETKKKIKEQIQRAEKGQFGNDTKEDVIRAYFVKEDYRTLVHKGYVYLMLGKKNEKND